MEASLYTLRLPNETLLDEVVVNADILEEKVDSTAKAE